MHSEVIPNRFRFTYFQVLIPYSNQTLDQSQMAEAGVITQHGLAVGYHARNITARYELSFARDSK